MIKRFERFFEIFRGQKPGGSAMAVPYMDFNEAAQIVEDAKALLRKWESASALFHHRKGRALWQRLYQLQSDPLHEAPSPENPGEFVLWVMDNALDVSGLEAQNACLRKQLDVAQEACRKAEAYTNTHLETIRELRGNLSDTKAFGRAQYQRIRQLKDLLTAKKIRIPEPPGGIR